MKAEDLFKELKRDIIKPVYYLYGDDDYLRDESLRRLKEAVLRGAIPDFNYDIFHCGEFEVSAVLSALSTYPVMAERRLVVMKEAERLKRGDEEELIPYVESPSPTAVLVMIGRDADRRKKLFSLLSKAGALVEHNRPYEREMPKWIRWIARKEGLEISDGACRYLADIVGNDLAGVAGEIEKISVYKGNGKRIEVEDVEAVTVDVKARTIFQLIDAMGARNLGASLENLKRLIDGGESHILILNMISRQLRMIWTGIEIMKKGGGEAELRKKIRLPPYVFKGYLGQLKKFNEEDLKEAFKEIYELDLKFKSSPVDKGKALELFLFRLCGCRVK